MRKKLIVVKVLINHSHKIQNIQMDGQMFKQQKQQKNLVILTLNLTRLIVESNLKLKDHYLLKKKQTQFLK